MTRFFQIFMVAFQVVGLVEKVFSGLKGRDKKTIAADIIGSVFNAVGEPMNPLDKSAISTAIDSTVSIFNRNTVFKTVAPVDVNPLLLDVEGIAWADSTIAFNADGREVFRDANGREFYVADDGHEVYRDTLKSAYTDSAGQSYYLNSEGREVYRDAEGREVYREVDGSGGRVIRDDAGRIIVDAGGRAVKGTDNRVTRDNEGREVRTTGRISRDADGRTIVKGRPDYQESYSVTDKKLPPVKRRNR